MNKELIKKHLERWEGLQVASIQHYAETGKITGFLYLAIEKMLDEHAKEAYNQAIRDAAESAEIKLQGQHKINGGVWWERNGISINKQSILKLLK